MNKKRNEKFYEKHAWIIFLIIGLIIILGGIPHMLGINTDPRLVQSISGETIESLRALSPNHFNLYDFYFRSGGLSDLGVAFFIIAISVFAYRKGEKWSWYAFWFVPTFFLTFIVLSLALPTDSQSTLIPPLVVFTLISILGLLLPIKNFFPKKIDWRVCNCHYDSLGSKGDMKSSGNDHCYNLNQKVFQVI